MIDRDISDRFLLDVPTWPANTSEDTWQRTAALASQPDVASWLIAKAGKTPYFNIDGYMDRCWLANPYPAWNGTRQEALGPYDPELASVRIHHILRKDDDRHHHDHPWEARTIILAGWYREVRLMSDGSEREFLRQPGDTCTLNYGEFHRIIEVSEGGAWTLFITWKKQGTWGFLVDGKRVPYREYLNL